MSKTARNLLVALALTLGLGAAAVPVGAFHHAGVVDAASGSAASTASPNDLSWG
ncbi:hypothetical protein [Streptacidiphilus sp. MAP5-3]|uniref:hypothetical protein n=1 Tax=unclassified Streptacidiphilus TaxID=2643834 RepID=UPI00351117C6